MIKDKKELLVEERKRLIRLTVACCFVLKARLEPKTVIPIRIKPVISSGQDRALSRKYRKKTATPAMAKLNRVKIAKKNFSSKLIVFIIVAYILASPITSAGNSLYRLYGRIGFFDDEQLKTIPERI